jgi:hypothetical protein
MIDQHQVLFIVFFMISFLWFVIGAGIFYGTYKAHWTKKQYTLAFIIAGPIVWFRRIDVIVISLISNIFGQIWNSKHLK